MRPALLALVVLLVTAAGAAAQDVDRVRSLYIAAAYEEALAAIPPAPSEVAAPDLERYRALCLFALGREEDAKAAIERLVRQHPAYGPPPAEMSPRMLAVFTETRTRIIPALARDAYLEARRAYDATELEAARDGFERALSLLEMLPEDARASHADLRLLAGEFLALSTPKPPPAPAPADPAVEEKPAPPKDPVLTPPVAIREVLPPWNPPDRFSMRTEYLGIVRVHIDETGRVTSTEVVKGSHPAYDAAVVAAARSWAYKPATRDGQPVASQKDLQIRLRPR